jgi:hypothetical protein
MCHKQATFWGLASPSLSAASLLIGHSWVLPRGLVCNICTTDRLVRPPRHPSPIAPRGLLPDPMLLCHLPRSIDATLTASPLWLAIPGSRLEVSCAISAQLTVWCNRHVIRRPSLIVASFLIQRPHIPGSIAPTSTPAIISHLLSHLASRLVIDCTATLGPDHVARHHRHCRQRPQHHSRELSASPCISLQSCSHRS